MPESIHVWPKRPAIAPNVTKATGPARRHCDNAECPDEKCLIDELADTVRFWDDMDDAMQALDVLIDIAACRQSLDSARRAVNTILSLYRDDQVSLGVLDAFGAKLADLYRVLRDRPDGNFGMPVALLHLGAQIARNDGGTSDDLLSSKECDAIDQRLQEAADIHDEKSLLNFARQVTTDEVSAYFATVSLALDAVVDIGADRVAQHGADPEYFTSAVQAWKQEHRVHPLLWVPLISKSENHFLLLAFERDRNGKSYATVVDTRGMLANNESSGARKLRNTIQWLVEQVVGGNGEEIRWLSQDIQGEDNPNSCGPLICRLVSVMEGGRHTDYDAASFEIAKAWMEGADVFLRQRAIAATRAEMIEAVVARRQNLSGDGYIGDRKRALAFVEVSN